MMNVVLSMPINFFPYIDFSFQVPYASTTSFSVSANNGKFRSNFFLNFLWDSTESTDPQDNRAAALDLIDSVAKRASLFRTTRRIVLRVEIQNNFLTPEIGKFHLLTLVI